MILTVHTSRFGKSVNKSVYLSFGLLSVLSWHSPYPNTELSAKDKPVEPKSGALYSCIARHISTVLCQGWRSIIILLENTLTCLYFFKPVTIIICNSLHDPNLFFWIWVDNSGVVVVSHGEEDCEPGDRRVECIGRLIPTVDIRWVRLGSLYWSSKDSFLLPLTTFDKTQHSAYQLFSDGCAITQSWTRWRNVYV